MKRKLSQICETELSPPPNVIDSSALVLDSFAPPSPPHKTSKSSSASAASSSSSSSDDENRLDQSEFPIPDHISDAEMEEFFVALKLNLEIYHYTSSLNLAERTIAFERTDKDADTLKPGPGPDGNVLSKEFLFDKKRATKLKEVWPALEVLLTERGVSATLNLDECQVEIATSALLKDLNMVDKARNLLILLTRSLIPPNMALEIFQGSREYMTIEIGYQKNGLCKTFGIKKKEYCKRWECLSCSIEALSKARCCHIFLNENTLTAVTTGKNSTLDGLRDDVKKCITKNLCLVDKFFDNVDSESPNCIGDSKDPHYKHYEVSSGYMLECDDDIMPAVCCLYAPICENLVTKLKEALPMLKSMLTGYGASCTLANDCMTLSSIERPQDPDIIDKEWQVLELLSTTHVPVSMASEIMSGNMQSGVFKIGNQEGGLCSLSGINKEEYLKQLNCLRYSLEALADVAECNIFLNENTVAAVGDSSAIGIVKAFIDDCILNNACPATAARNYKILSQGLKSIEDPHVKHVEMENPGSLSDMPEVTSYCMFFDIKQASEVSKHWDAVKMFFNKYNISCQLVFEAAQYMYIIMSTTRRSGDPDFIDRTWDFLKLLLNNVPVLKAIEVLKSSQHCDFFEAGSAYGHFCSKFGITEEQFGKRVFPRVSQGLKAFSSCHHHISVNNIAIYGSTWEHISRLRDYVLNCYTYEAFTRSSDLLTMDSWSRPDNYRFSLFKGENVVGNDVLYIKKSIY